MPYFGYILFYFFIMYTTTIAGFNNTPVNRAHQQKDMNILNTIKKPFCKYVNPYALTVITDKSSIAVD